MTTPQEQWMEERRKDIENILIEEMCDCNPYGKYQTRQDVALALLTFLTTQIELAEKRGYQRGKSENGIVDGPYGGDNRGNWRGVTGPKA